MLQREVDRAVLESLSALVSSGAYREYASDSCTALERELSLLAEAEGTVLTSSGTAALEITLRATGVGAGDSVVLAGYEYPGNFGAIERVGARPLLVDVVAGGWTLDAKQAETALAGPDQPKPKAIIASYLHGCAPDLQHLRTVCDKAGVLLIEDACQAIGGVCAGRACGTWGDAAIFSFGGGKVISSGRGGAAVTTDRGLAQKMRVAMGSGSGAYGMSELQAATVLAQLPWLQRINAQCLQFSDELAESLQANVPEEDLRRGGPVSELRLERKNLGSQAISMPWRQQSLGAFYQIGILINPLVDRASSQIAARDKVISGLKSQGVRAGTGFSGFHRRSQRRCDRVGDLSNTCQLVDRMLTIHHSIAMERSCSAPRLARLLEELLTD